ncbi:hypothetical protein D9M71_235340 [compost metagenome]
MGDRRGHQQHLRRAVRPVLEGTLEARRAGVVRMQHGLRPAGGAGGVEHQLDRVRVGRRQFRQGLLFAQQLLVAARATVEAHADQQTQLRQFAGNPPHHFGEVEAAIAPREEHRLGAAVGQHVGHFGVAIDRHDGHDHQPEQAGGQVDDRRLAPVRQLEGDGIARPQSAPVQRAGEMAGVAQEFVDAAGFAIEDMGDAAGIDAGDLGGGLGDAAPHPFAAAGVALLQRRVLAYLPAADVVTHGGSPEHFPGTGRRSAGSARRDCRTAAH